MERASLSRYAFHPHAAAHEAYQTRADGQPQAGAALSSGVGSVGLNKGVEDAALPLRRDSHAGIGNRDVHLQTVLVFLWANLTFAARTAAPLGLAFCLGLPVAAYLASGASFTLVYPEMSRFNVRGGIEILPEFAALVLGLVVYTAAFIAEGVRAGISAVPRGQTEAALALGLSRMTTLRLVIVPQAMRVIIPPLTNQYLNLTKNSSLAVAIGYPDLVQIFTGTVLNQTGQAVEIVAVTMAVYLVISLATSFLMNIYNARMALAER